MSIGLGISVLAPITFKDLETGSYPNEWNTLHKNLNEGNYMIKDYCQKFKKSETVSIQLYSSDSTPPVLKSYNYANEVETLTLGTSTTISGNAGDITYFTFLVNLNSSYWDKVIHFEATQDTDKLTSEPIYVTDLTEKITQGRIKRIDCSNFLRGEAGLKGYWVLWDDLYLDQLHFYVDAQTRELNDQSESEVLESAQSDVLISSKLKAGVQLQMDYMPKYMARKINAASLVDFFAVNEVEYIRDGDADFEVFGNSTVFQGSLNLVEKNTLGLNVISLGFETTTTNDTDMVEVIKRTDETGSFNVSVPDGYMLHAVFVRHSATSSGTDATLSAGSTVGGQEYISQFAGIISGTKSHNFPIHDNPQTGDSVYFDISGIGVKLDVTIQFILNS